MRLAATIVIPSYRRAHQLANCLEGVFAQQLGAADVIVVVRDDDDDTIALVNSRKKSCNALELAFVARPGLVAAMNCGAARAAGHIVAFVDDDAVPRRDWLERIVATFAADPRTAAVGGKDVVHAGSRIYDDTQSWAFARWRTWRAPTVGRLRWFGRMTSSHNAGTGPPRDVHVLKGANMAYRRDLLIEHGFDERLRGRGAQVHNEATACLPLVRRGYRVVYDPAIIVDHYPSARPHGDDRHRLDPETVRDATHNYVLGLLDHLAPVRRCVLIVWMLLVGTGPTPGLANALRNRLAQQPDGWRRMRATQDGVLLAVRTWRQVPRPRFADAECEAGEPGS